MPSQTLVDEGFKTLHDSLEQRRIKYLNDTGGKTIFKIDKRWSNTLYVAFDDGTWIYLEARTENNGEINLDVPYDHQWDLSEHTQALTSMGVMTGEEQNTFERLMQENEECWKARNKTYSIAELERLIEKYPDIAGSILKTVDTKQCQPTQ